MTRPPEPRSELTRFGFRFGAAEVKRATTLPGGRVVISIETDAGKYLNVHVSRTGRSMRVFGEQEWRGTTKMRGRQN